MLKILVIIMAKVQDCVILSGMRGVHICVIPMGRVHISVIRISRVNTLVIVMDRLYIWVIVKSTVSI